MSEPENDIVEPEEEPDTIKWDHFLANEAGEHECQIAFTCFFLCLYGDWGWYLSSQDGRPVLDAKKYLHNRRLMGDSEGTAMFPLVNKFVKSALFEGYVKDRINEILKRDNGSTMFHKYMAYHRKEKIMFTVMNVRRTVRQVTESRAAAGKRARVRQVLLAVTSNQQFQGNMLQAMENITEECREVHQTLAMVMGVIWFRIRDSQGGQWRHAHNGLLLLRYLLIHGPVTAVTEATNQLGTIFQLRNYTTRAFGGGGEQVRRLAVQVYKLIVNRSYLFSRRRFGAEQRRLIKFPRKKKLIKQTNLKIRNGFKAIHEKLKPNMASLQVSDLLTFGEPQIAPVPSEKPVSSSYADDLLSFDFAAPPDVSSDKAESVSGSSQGVTVTSLPLEPSVVSGSSQGAPVTSLPSEVPAPVPAPAPVSAPVDVFATPSESPLQSPPQDNIHVQPPRASDPPSQERTFAMPPPQNLPKPAYDPFSAIPVPAPVLSQGSMEAARTGAVGPTGPASADPFGNIKPSQPGQPTPPQHFQNKQHETVSAQQQHENPFTNQPPTHYADNPFQSNPRTQPSATSHTPHSNQPPNTANRYPIPSQHPNSHQQPNTANHPPNTTNHYPTPSQPPQNYDPFSHISAPSQPTPSPNPFDMHSLYKATPTKMAPVNRSSSDQPTSPPPNQQLQSRHASDPSISDPIVNKPNGYFGTMPQPQPPIVNHQTKSNNMGPPPVQQGNYNHMPQGAAPHGYHQPQPPQYQQAPQRPYHQYPPQQQQPPYHQPPQQRQQQPSPYHQPPQQQQPPYRQPYPPPQQQQPPPYQQQQQQPPYRQPYPQQQHQQPSPYQQQHHQHVPPSAGTKKLNPFDPFA
eukprot:CAMPEP_0172488046 /NCGR_PEP_ID=MMETSP1066-20121228/17396_1 /TAXON_ID=671091 /ORGANISM="Coscinodiscus wailesii, Strain CCMP2513" /LENGTH=850 /DNA_ID=CAMNT_0013255027 /DNA_START=201 /DNA_END=2753 /DNA_ORIENTATION=+